MTKTLPSTDLQISTLIDEFLDEVARKPAAGGNLIFALDATMSRQPTWDAATHLQGQMFSEVASIGAGALDVQAVYFRGAEHINAECRSSQWLSDPAKLAAYMTGVRCLGGLTQITRVFDHVLRESNQRKIGALIFIGDACEELRVNLIPLARRLANLGIPIFMFLEGNDVEAEMIFREIAQVTKGAFSRFDQGSAKQLVELLRAAALFATGGIAALEGSSSDAARLLLGQIR
jgi:hypothetical protein